MKYILIAVICCFFSFNHKAGGIYTCKEIKAKLYSEAPIENIEAISSQGFSVINFTTSEIQFNIPIHSFQFKKSLMKEHFNENYMESDKYPNATFKGKINEKIDPSKDGDYPVTVTGELEVHGVKQQRTISGNIKAANNQLSINSQFNVLCKDHQIEIPKLVFKKIAEIIQITISGTFTPYSPSKN
jgi:hypothetical protein